MQAFQIILLILVTAIFIRLIFRKLIDLPAYSGPLLTDNSDITELMPEDEFWQIIKEAGNLSKKQYLLQCEILTAYLSNLSKEEIIQFDRTFSCLMAKSYSFKLWEPAYALNGGCSDDAFEYFRSWLIAQGKNKFYWSIKYPRVLFLFAVKELLQNYEGIALCAYEAYRNKTGLEIPTHDDIQYADGGRLFRENEAFFRYPELALLAW